MTAQPATKPAKPAHRDRSPLVTRVEPALRRVRQPDDGHALPSGLEADRDIELIAGLPASVSVCTKPFRRNLKPVFRISRAIVNNSTDSVMNAAAVSSVGLPAIASS